MVLIDMHKQSNIDRYCQEATGNPSSRQVLVKLESIIIKCIDTLFEDDISVQYLYPKEELPLDESKHFKYEMIDTQLITNYEDSMNYNDFIQIFG